MSVGRRRVTGSMAPSKTAINPATGRRTTGLVAVLAGVMGICAACQHTTPPARATLIKVPVTCADFTFPIYFEPGSAAVTKEASQLFAAAQDRARACDVTGIVVVGLADAPGDVGANLALSKRRADAVALALHRRGYNAVEFRVSAAGDLGAVTQGGDTKPLRRRADVSVHLTDRRSAPKP